MSESSTATQHDINRLWEAHTAAEFAHRDPDAALATMGHDPTVIHLPTLNGGRGREQLHAFYARHFLNQLPPDLVVTPRSRTIGDSRVVDELLLSFTHSMTMDWILPGIAPTDRRIELALVVVVHFDRDKIVSETVYYDGASVLRQAGLLPDPALPVIGAEAARSLVEPVALNPLLPRAAR